jgi:hypothetical protein
MIDTNSEAFRGVCDTIHATFLANLLRHTSLNDAARKIMHDQMTEFSFELLTAYESAKPNKTAKLVFHNRETKPLSITIETTRDGVPSIMYWYWCCYAGQPYTVTYDGRNVPMEACGVPVGWNEGESKS